MLTPSPLPGEETPVPRWRPWVRHGALVAAAVGLAWALGKREAPRAPAPPLKTAYWYWHQPFRLSSLERRQLAAAKVERLYVLAGTVVRRGPGLALTSRQRWTDRAPVPLVGVFRVESSALPVLLSPEGGAQVAALLREAELPEDAIGVQWDADVPTKRLPDYRRFLQRARDVVPESRLLSITALPDWFASPDFASLCNSVDELAPQFYGNSWPREGREPPSLWETDGLLDQVRRAAAGGKKVWVGLPAYGRCLVADEAGRFSGVRHDLDPEALFDDPLWTAAHASTRAATFSPKGAPVSYEDALLLRSGAESLAESVLFRSGTSLWFQWPRVEGLRAAATELTTAGIPGVEGISLFRWPVPTEPLALDPIALSAEAGATAGTLTLRLEREGERVAVVVRNQGVDSPRLADGIQVEVMPAGGEVEARSEAAGYLGEERTSLLRADRARFARPLLRPGTRWTPCEILRPKETVTAELHWTDAQGPHITAIRLGPPSHNGVTSDAPR